MNTLRALACLLLLAPAAQADQFQQFGNYQVHYIVFNSTELDPAIARNYGIKRSGRLAFINVSLLHTAPGRLPVGVPASISGTATNLIQQQRSLEFREIRETGAVYYVATLSVSNEEIYRFDLAVVPEGATAPLQVKFEQKVWVEED